MKSSSLLDEASVVTSILTLALGSMASKPVTVSVNIWVRALMGVIQLVVCGRGIAIE